MRIGIGKGIRTVGHMELCGWQMSQRAQCFHFPFPFSYWWFPFSFPVSIYCSVIVVDSAVPQTVAHLSQQSRNRAGRGQMSKTNASTPNFHLVNVWKCLGGKTTPTTTGELSTYIRIRISRHQWNNNMNLSICHVDICLAIYFPSATCAQPPQISLVPSRLVPSVHLPLSAPFSSVHCLRFLFLDLFLGNGFVQLEAVVMQLREVID